MPASSRSRACTQFLLGADELNIMRHMLGIREDHPEPYRNFYDAGAQPEPGKEDKDWIALLALERRGYVARSRTPGFMPGDAVVFHVTKYGEAIDLSFPEPKLTRSQRRYRRWLSSDGAFGSFSEFLKANL